ncbi:hypothetical protein DIE18_12635 [Burkholderia sp. Bp9125]|nr:hypothetical protein DIE18_12635 [Burkholderia sp. Bp9125]
MLLVLSKTEEIAIFASDRKHAPVYYPHDPIIGVLASQARHDSRPSRSHDPGVLSPGLVGGW